MAEIVDLNTYRTKVIEQRGFGPWQRRFGEACDHRTRLADLSDTTLYRLATPGDQSAGMYYELVMGILDLGQAHEFDALDKKNQLQVMEIHLFLVDQIRFEMLHRLGWVDRFGGQDFTLLEMVLNFDTVKLRCKSAFPKLAASHPEYDAFQRLTDKDKEVFVRRLLSSALETFALERSV